MRADIKERWVNALRSGKYVQGKQALNRDGQLCCLGVLCVLAVEDGMLSYGPDTVFDDNRLAYFGPDGYLETQMLPVAVVDWAGLNEETYGDISVTVPMKRAPRAIAEASTTGTAYTSLTELNDDWNFDFNQIADIIEAQL